MIVTIEFEESPLLSLREDIRVLCIPCLLIEEPCEFHSTTYLDIIHDHLKLLLQELICQVWIQYY